MPGDHDPFDDLRAAWRDQPLSDSEPDMTGIETAARSFERDIRRRNVLEWVAIGMVIAFFAPVTFSDLPLLSRIGAAGVCLGSGWVGWVLYARGGVPEAPDPALDTRRFLDAHREALLAQARLLRRAPVWYVGPIVLPAALLLVGIGLETGWRPFLIGALPSVALTAGVIGLNLRKARQLTESASRLPDPAEVHEPPDPTT